MELGLRVGNGVAVDGVYRVRVRMTDVEARTVLATEQNDITKRLFAAVAYGETAFVERLLRSTERPAIDLNSRDNNGYTCLGVAATEGNVALVKLLVEVRHRDHVIARR